MNGQKNSEISEKNLTKGENEKMSYEDLEFVCQNYKLQLENTIVLLNETIKKNQDLELVIFSKNF